jgi:hypothetical protein
MNDLSVDPQSLGSITITAPTDGYVVLGANASVTLTDGASITRFGLGTTPGAFNLDATDVGEALNTDTFPRYFSAASAAVVPVSQGEHTFYVSANKTYCRSCRVDIVGTDFYGIFVPNRY